MNNIKYFWVLISFGFLSTATAGPLTKQSFQEWYINADKNQKWYKAAGSGCYAPAEDEDAVARCEDLKKQKEDVISARLQDEADMIFNIVGDTQPNPLNGEAPMSVQCSKLKGPGHSAGTGGVWLAP